MSEQIKAFFSALQANHELIGRLYETRQGIHPSPDDEHQVTKLLRLNVVRRAHDASYRLESNLRRAIDKAFNRRRQFAISTHYSDILQNLRTAIEGFLESLIVSDPAVLADKLNTIFELCDDFASGMTEDLENFRNVVQTSAGFTGDTLEERIRYNVNRLNRARELLTNLEQAKDNDLLEESSKSSDLLAVLEKEFFDRQEGLLTRLREVVNQLSQNLFLLKRMDERVLDLIALDNHLSRFPDFITKSWEALEQPPECFLRFEGFDVVGFPDPYSPFYDEELGIIFSKIKDSSPDEVRVLRSSEVEDQGPPEDRDLPVTAFSEAFYKFIEDVLDQGEASAVEWVRNNTAAFGYGEVVWLQMISNQYTNNALVTIEKMPEYVGVEVHRDDVGDELNLLDFTFYVEEEEING